MLTNNRIYLGAVLLILGFMFVFVVSQVVYSFSPESKISHCDGMENWDLQIDCVYESMRNEINNRGLEPALRILDTAHKINLPPFVRAECHRHAHNLGDMLYYEIYVKKGGFGAIKFPEGSTICSYGVFHGFLEHLIQDNPYPEFVVEICEYLDNELGDTMGAIRGTCYHGSGHGFMLRQAEILHKNDWGNLTNIIEAPIRDCEKLVSATSSEIEKCREGVFNVVVNWMTDEQYGLKFDFEDSFAVCDNLETIFHKLCYKEIMRKIGVAYEYNPVNLLSILEKPKHPNLSYLYINKGLIDIERKIGYKRMLMICNELNDEFFEDCVLASAESLYESGYMQEEYKGVMLVCEEGLVIQRGMKRPCYEQLSSRLNRYYSNDRIRSICKEFPTDMRHYCEEQLK
jgi:hypothetical protein